MTNTSTVSSDAETSLLSVELLARLCDLLVAERSNAAAQVVDHRATVSQLTGATDVDSMLDREVAEAAVKRSGDVIADIDHALARVQAGTYGTCTLCGSPIPFERLEAIPQTLACVRCAASA